MMRRALPFSFAVGLAFSFACAKQAQKKQGPDFVDTTGGKKPSKSIVTPAQQDTTTQAFEQLVGKYKGGVDFDDLESDMDSFINKHGDYPLAWYNKGVAQQKQGKIDDAVVSYERSLNGEDGPEEAGLNLCTILIDRGRPKDCVDILRRLADRDPGAANARVVLAEQYLAEGDSTEAVRLVREALDRDPKNTKAYCVLADVAFAKEDFQLARLVVSQGFKIDEKIGCLHHTLGKILYKEGRTAEAIAEFDRAVTEQPKLIEAQFAIADISMGFKDFRKAISSYAAVTKVEPKNAAAYVNLGVAFKGNGQFDEAEKAYMKALQVSGGATEPPEAHFNLGVLYLRHKKDLPKAREHLKRCLQLSPDFGDEVYRMLEEIDQREQMAREEKRMMEEMKRQEAEQKRQEEVEKRLQMEEEKRKKAEDAAVKREEARQQKIDAQVAEEEKRREEEEKKLLEKQQKAAPKKEAPKPAEPTPDEPDDPDL